MCFDSNLEVIWDLEGKNAEHFHAFEKKGNSLTLVGTTPGEVLMISSKTGEILLENKKISCTNMVRALPNEKFVVSCHDDGQIYGYVIEDW